MEVGIARCWSVWPLENGEWAWNRDHGQSQSGISQTEAEAQQAAERELEQIAAEARATAPQERELPARDHLGSIGLSSPDADNGYVISAAAAAANPLAGIWKAARCDAKEPPRKPTCLSAAPKPRWPRSTPPRNHYPAQSYADI